MYNILITLGFVRIFESKSQVLSSREFSRDDIASLIAALPKILFKVSFWIRYHWKLNSLLKLVQLYIMLFMKFSEETACILKAGK